LRDSDHKGNQDGGGRGDSERDDESRVPVDEVAKSAADDQADEH
jgi:hypothetical protein